MKNKQLNKWWLPRWIHVYKETMFGLGFSLNFPLCLEDEDGKLFVRIWSLRFWIGSFIFLINFNKCWQFSPEKNKENIE